METPIKTLLNKANQLPLLPGVYIMLDDRGEVIYVGKAKKLKNRVSSYFHGDHLPKVAAMVEKVADFQVIVAGSEFEALVLENSLIKRHKPHYNILLKDDKGYPFIRMDRREAYPRMEISARAEKDGADYYGPFGGRNQSREIIDAISKALLLPDCSRVFPRDVGKERHGPKPYAAPEERAQRHGHLPRQLHDRRERELVVREPDRHYRRRERDKTPHDGVGMVLEQRRVRHAHVHGDHRRHCKEHRYAAATRSGHLVYPARVGLIDHAAGAGKLADERRQHVTQSERS